MKGSKFVHFTDEVVYTSEFTDEVVYISEFTDERVELCALY